MNYSILMVKEIEEHVMCQKERKKERSLHFAGLEFNEESKKETKKRKGKEIKIERKILNWLIERERNEKKK